MSETIIKVDHVSKQYRLGTISGGTLKGDLQSVWARWRGREDPNEQIGQAARGGNARFLALDDVSFEVKKGEALGIIGHNGAGKSTLLKLLSRVTAPTKGTICYNGRIASMLEVGTGFHPELTGRENVYLNGAILGMTKTEIDRKFDQIVSFAEMEQFIDTPVKRYSSGMYVKLAFAVAAHLDSEILVMDEVLAVGDMKFQQKCLGKMSNVANEDGRTVLYVSHNMSTIRQLCTRCIVLDQGRIIFDGDVEKAIAIYMDTTDVNVVHYDLRKVGRMNLGAGQRLRLESLRFLDKESSVFADNEPVRVQIRYRVNQSFTGVRAKLEIRSRDGSSVGITQPIELDAVEAGKMYTTTLEFDPSLLGEGQYFFYLDIYESTLTHPVCLDKPVTEFAFEVHTSDPALADWQPYWGHTHFPPLKLREMREV